MGERIADRRASATPGARPVPEAAAPAPRRRRRPPAALVVLMATSLVLGIAWAAILPAFQAPDEQSHFGAVQALGERFALTGDPTRKQFSSEDQIAGDYVNVNQVAGQLFARPEWSQGLERRWKAAGRDGAGAPRDDGGGPNTAAANPPLAYLWDTLGYVVAKGGDFFDRLFAARIAGLLWLPITVLGTWLLAGEAFGRRRTLQLAAAAVPALAPMVVFVSSSVNPDGMLYALSALALWLGVRCARRGMDLAHGAALFAAIGLACTVKATAYAFLPAAFAVVVMELARRRPDGVRRVLRLGLTALVPLALTLGVWLVISRSLGRAAAPQIAGAAAGGGGTNLREFVSYAWQFYLPRLPFMSAFPNPAGPHPWYVIWVKQGWAAFGWLEVKFPDPVYKVLVALGLGSIVASLVALWRGRRGVGWRPIVFVALFAGGLLAGLHWTDYHQLVGGAKGFMQGRYLFPLIGLGGLAVAGAISLLAPRRRPLGVAVAVGLLFVLQVFSIGLVMERFYA